MRRSKGRAALTDNVNLFVRPGIAFQTNGKIGGPLTDRQYSTRKTAGADLGVQWFITERFSLGAGYGIRWSESVVENGASLYYTQASGISNIGFHFCF